MSTDKQGRPYAILADLKPGDLVEVDDGFTCLRKSEICEVRQRSDGRLYINCSGYDNFHKRSQHKNRDEQHFLDGQIDKTGALIGVYRSEKRA